jgi:coenzyme F420-dependent glucose-6-phosphate dehydrogenase
MRYFYGAAHEQFTPRDLLLQATEAEQAGFDGLACSDHNQPWWPGGEAGHAWFWLGAVAASTAELPFGTAVTPAGARHHPLEIAQAWATMEQMYPGRPFLGFGSGESLNETPAGDDWPDVGGQIDRMEEALEMIDALWRGDTITRDGPHFKANAAKLHTLPEGRPPIYISAFGPKAAAVAGRWGDGLWTLADPEQAPGVIDAYRSAAEDAGKEPGEIVLQAQFSWAQDDATALEGARVWKGAQPSEFYTDDWHDPKEMYEEGERQVSDDDLKEAIFISSDPAVHVDRIREVEKMGATTVALMNVSGAGPHDAIRTYGVNVLPELNRSVARAR